MPKMATLGVVIHKIIRIVTKSKSLFPNADALKKMLFLAYRDLSKKWTMSFRNWAILISHFSIYFNERFLTLPKSKNYHLHKKFYSLKNF